MTLLRPRGIRPSVRKGGLLASPKAGGASRRPLSNPRISSGTAMTRELQRQKIRDVPDVAAGHAASPGRSSGPAMWGGAHGCRRVASRSWPRPIRGQVPGQQGRHGPASAADRRMTSGTSAFPPSAIGDGCSTPSPRWLARSPAAARSIARGNTGVLRRPRGPRSRSKA